jgi:Coenzyme PQQ synthesis protein D (PqqD)
MTSTKADRPITATSVVVAAQDLVSSELAGETVILSFQTGKYYGLDTVGGRIWGLLGAAIRVADLCDAIVRHFDVPPDRCERDVLNFLHEMARAGLVELRDDADS